MPLLQVPVHGHNQQQRTQGGPARQAHAPLTSVESVIHGLRLQECHPIAGFRALSQAQSTQPTLDGLSVIDRAKRLIGQTVSRSVRYTCFLIIAPPTSRKHTLPIRHVERAVG